MSPLVLVIPVPQLPRPSRALWIALIVTLAFSMLARWLRGVSPSGAVAGAVVCFALFAGAGPSAFFALASVFVLTWITTRLGYRRKQILGTAQNPQGRTGFQVLANLSVSALCAGLFAATGRSALLLGMAAALSEAAADTVSSELGQALSENARLITTWKLVAAGTDGGVSLPGTAGGIAAAALVSLVLLLGRLLSREQFAIPVLAATIGMIGDGCMGATLERRKLLSNNWVNFLGTLIATGVALSLS